MARIRWGAIGLAGAIGGAACVADSAETPWAALVDTRACNVEVDSILSRWGASGEVLPSPPLPGLPERYRLPTGRRGSWVLLDLPVVGAPVVTRVRPADVARITFTADCVSISAPDTTYLPATALPAGERVFTDADLTAALATTERRGAAGLVVYVWSPHMPLSVDGWREISAAGDRVGFELTPVLFAGSDPGFAEREATRGGIPRDGLREVASVDLVLRDAHVHAPTIVVFTEGRTSAALPGYRNADGYTRYVEAFLADTTMPR